MDIDNSPPVATFADLPHLCLRRICKHAEGFVDARVNKAMRKALDSNRFWKNRFLELQTPTTSTLAEGHRRREIKPRAREILRFAEQVLEMDLSLLKELGVIEAYAKSKDQILQEAAKNPLALYKAAEQGRVEVVRLLLGEEGVRGAVDQALSAAAGAGHAEIVRLLLGKGISGRYLIFAFAEAVKAGHLEAVQLLLDQLDTEVSINSIAYGLGVATEAGHVDIMKLLSDRLALLHKW